MNCAGFALALTLAANVRANSGDIQRYTVAKEHKFAQTSVTPSIEAVNPWRLTAEIVATSGTSAGNSSVQSPKLTFLTNTINMSFPYDTNNNIWRIRQTFSDKPSLDAACPNGSYAFFMPTVTAPATTFNATLGVTGDAYPNTAPTVTNTS